MRERGSAFRASKMRPCPELHALKGPTHVS